MVNFMGLSIKNEYNLSHDSIFLVPVEHIDPKNAPSGVW